MGGFAAQALRAALLLACLAAGAWLGGELLLGTAAVAGRSMAPALLPGDRVLVDRWTYGRRPPRPGEVALVESPDGRLMIKRVARPPAGPGPPLPAGRVWVLGDNRPESEDSRRFGPLRQGQVRGRVVWRYWPPSRFGPIAGEAVTGLRLPVR